MSDPASTPAGEVKIGELTAPAGGGAATAKKPTPTMVMAEAKQIEAEARRTEAEVKKIEAAGKASSEWWDMVLRHFLSFLFGAPLVAGMVGCIFYWNQGGKEAFPAFTGTFGGLIGFYFGKWTTK